MSMFMPRFNYTHSIVKNLVTIGEARALIHCSALVPKWEVTLRREALIRSAHASTAIEGNNLSLDEVSALAEGREIMAMRKDRQEVLNYLAALEKIPEFARRKEMKAVDLLELHALVTKETLEDPADEGVFRNRQVVVANSKTGRIIFSPPPTGAVPGLVDEFLEWMSSPSSAELEPVIEAGLIHYELVRIHPFIDGNGRTARVMASLVFYRRGFDLKRFFALDDYYDQDRRGYYAALQSVNPDTLDLTAWLEYFTEGVAVSIKAVKDKVQAISKGIKTVRERGQISLNERQMKIVEKIVSQDKITIAEVAKDFGITRQAALKEMDKLIDLNVIELRGKGRASYYEAV